MNSAHRITITLFSYLDFLNNKKSYIINGS